MTVETLQPRPGAEHLRELAEVATGFHAGRVFAFVSLETNKTLLERPFEATPSSSCGSSFARSSSEAVGPPVSAFRRAPARAAGFLRRPVGSRRDRGRLGAELRLAFGIRHRHSPDEHRPRVRDRSRSRCRRRGIRCSVPAGLVESKEDGTYGLLGLFGGAIEQEVTIAPRSLLVVEVLSAVRAIELTVPIIPTQMGPFPSRSAHSTTSSRPSSWQASSRYRTTGPSRSRRWCRSSSWSPNSACSSRRATTGRPGPRWTRAPQMQSVGTYLMTRRFGAGRVAAGSDIRSPMASERDPRDDGLLLARPRGARRPLRSRRLPRRYRPRIPVRRTRFATPIESPAP